MRPQRILTDAEVIAAFGDPTPYVREDGRIDPHWELIILKTFPLPAAIPLSGAPAIMVRRATCHRLVAPFLSAALDRIYVTPGLWQTINDWGGCYNWRLQRKAKSLSRHCWGLGPDMDVADNPMGAPGKIDPRVVEIMEEAGFYWGGRFHAARRDDMHFEYADLSRLT